MNVPVHERPDFDLIKRQIEAQLADYERAAAEAIEWYRDWCHRNPQREAAE